MEEKNQKEESHKPAVTKKGELAAPSVDQVKSLFYLFNGKPDSQIKLLKKPKTISLGDLQNLKEAIDNKLDTENLVVSATSILLQFHSNKIWSFKSYAEFNRTNFKIPDKTKSMTIQWELFIKLHNYEMPQKHTLTFRIGSELKPSEVFHLLMMDDKDEILPQATSPAVVKVDFVNAVLATELLSIVERWYGTLENNEKSDAIIRFTHRRRRYMAFLLESFYLFIILIFLFLIFRYTLLNIDFQNWSQGHFVKFTLLSFISYGVVKIVMDLANIHGANLFKRLTKYESYSEFKFTSGDVNAIADIKRKNNSIKTKVLLQLGIGFAISLIMLAASGFFKFFWEFITT